MRFGWHPHAGLPEDEGSVLPPEVEEARAARMREEGAARGEVPLGGEG